MAAERRQEHRDAARHDVGRRLGHGGIGHVLELDAGEVAEQDGGEMPAGAGAERGVVQFAGMRLGVVDQFLHRPERRVRRHQQDILRGGHQHDGVEVLERIELLARLQRDVDAQRLRAEMQRIAVRRGLRRHPAPILPPPPGRFSITTFWPQVSPSLLRQDAAQRVDGAAGGNAIKMRTGRSG